MPPKARRNRAVAPQNVPPDGDGQGRPARREPARRFTIEDWFIVAVVILGMGGGAFLWVSLQPPALTSVFVAAGISALVFRFLGGLHGSTFAFGAIRLGGSLGALMAVFYVMNYYLNEQKQRLDTDLAGQWKWQYVDEGWLGRFTLQTTKARNQYSVIGAVKKGGRALFDIVGGTATRSGDGALNLDLRVKDVRDGARDVTWRTAGGGLMMNTCFAGSFNVFDSGTESSDYAPWGIALERY
jgi:hypothetical protein